MKVKRDKSGQPIEIEMTRPDDWHLHLRDGAAMADVLPHTARQFARAIVMPNLRPPVVTVKQAKEYYDRIVFALNVEYEYTKHHSVAERAARFPLMTLYLTDNTSVEEIRRAKACGFVHGVKLYPAGATTNSDAGVTDIRKCWGALEAMQREDLPLLVHGEVTRVDVDVFDREAYFIDEVLIPLRRDFPALRVVFEHVTTRQAVQYVAEAEGQIAATITAHHLLFNRNALFLTPEGRTGVRPHYYCLPVLKREEHRKWLVGAATGDNSRFFLGTDSAPHPKGDKENACGCAGCFTEISAMEMYTMAFEKAAHSVGLTFDEVMSRLEEFASFRGADFYGLPRNGDHITLVRRPWTVPAELPFGDSTVVPLCAGEMLDWQVVEV